AAVEVAGGEEVVAQGGDRREGSLVQEGPGPGDDLGATIVEGDQYHHAVVLLGVSHAPGIAEFFGELAGLERRGGVDHHHGHLVIGGFYEAAGGLLDPVFGRQHSGIVG